ncbi:protein bicaudal C homolog 1 [Nilaparvata lugens]|uniref:protein bicaudal C homolog 1 n=1 Tax=Nilaparvata lugens TaxID=108931 RepID=UPI00193E5722|nr:protein bicaudal C homolog 1 [Nilaparvata lugens]
MTETNTHVLWPSRLKIGSKSHKDPYIRVLGRLDDIKIAKNKIMSVLDTRGSRVMMKLEVSYTDHSHIIGKGGLVIKEVMEETGCHIHFPDSNRNNPNEKSNQVSIAGEISKVEKARSRIRELSSLAFTFQLPVMGTVHSASELASSYITGLQERYNVHVKFQTQSKLYSTLVVVKGCEQEVKQVEEATLQLVHRLCGPMAVGVQIQMFMEISPHHHQIVRGNGDSNLLKIMGLTKTKILFPDVDNPCVPTLKKSNVSITGAIHDVYLARQMLMGSLPLLLMFELEDKFPSTDQINTIMYNLQLSIIVKQKPRLNSISIIIKGIERQADNIYEAYRQLKGLKEQRIVASIPSTYNIPNFPTPMKPVKVNEPPMGCQNIPGLPGNLPEPDLNQLFYQISQFFSQHQQQGSLNENALGQVSSLSLPDIFKETHSSQNSRCSSPMLSPNSKSAHGSGQIPNISSDLSLSANSNDWRAPGFGRKSHIEYQEMKQQALLALQTKPHPDDPRVPTSTWAGYGLSRSGPAVVMNELQNSSDVDGAWGGASQGNQYGNSNILEAVSSQHMEVITSSESYTIPSLLASLNLEMYIPLFHMHHIDLPTFRTLTEQDLKEIGVSLVGARRRILASIAELNRSQSNLAPGLWDYMERSNSSNASSNGLE